ncbi:MAG: hypothetical protein JW750_08330, partial [Anaerolineaceae bacterium]|nr:hypothetical protein [Anaerolineaceae bacterium]
MEMNKNRCCQRFYLFKSNEIPVQDVTTDGTEMAVCFNPLKSISKAMTQNRSIFEVKVLEVVPLGVVGVLIPLKSSAKRRLKAGAYS